MGKAMFAVVLIAASFGGGAVVNGPGLRWAQAMVQNRLGFSVDDGGESAADGIPVVATAPEVPTRPIPPPVVAPAAAAKDLDRNGAGTKVEAPAPTGALVNVPAPPDVKAPPRPLPDEPTERRPAATAADTPVPLPGLAPIAEESLPPLDPPAPLVTARDRDRSALAMAKADAADAPLPLTGPEPTPPDTGPAGKDQGAPLRRASLAADVPKKDVVTVAADPEAETPAPSPSPAAEPADWAEVRRAMRSMGVSRYGIDGEPSGRVRFHCVIPLAGRRAVGQHFEAEGDDELQAARAALRRVVLWRATEGQPPAP